MSRTLRRPSLDGGQYDIVVIGGGINGVAIARECARAGRRTLLVEKHDFASGTTSRSTRIIHGGLRYLEHGELGLVRESLRERERLLRQRPHLVRPKKFLLALKPGGRRNAMAIRAGLWLYGALGGKHLQASARHSAELERLLDSERQLSIFQYDDAQCEFPERLVAEWLSEAIAAGADARNHTSAIAIEHADGRVRGAHLRDEFSGDESRVAAKWVINASGPWADRVCESAAIATEQPLIGGVRGSHLVLRSVPGMPENAVYCEATDGRPVFLIPWNGQHLLGTTEVRDSSDPDRTEPTAEEIAYLLDSFRNCFPRIRLGAEDIRYAFAGVRPLPHAPGRDAATITRRAILHDHADDGVRGMVSIIGGKLTTAAQLARDVARKVGVRVDDEPLPACAIAPVDGMEITLRHWSHQVSAMAGISPMCARRLAEWHGCHALTVARLAKSADVMRAPLCAHTDHIVAEAVHAARYECAVTLGDLLLRRVPVALSGCWSEECSHTAALHIGRVLGWGPEQMAAEVEEFEAERAMFLRRPATLHLWQHVA
ncbi:MAG TPA: glycerol-3-phosphate dehydrogenase/oxidase [Usitatibacter sp.]|nr:glycerol-3-phosphate dehydrogenase/oxidase [Usitatibacter sp.]